VKFIKENVYSNGRGETSDLLNRLLHEFVGLVPSICLTLFFFKVNINLLSDELPRKIIPYFIME
jgi:hypothetical protein